VLTFVQFLLEYPVSDLRYFEALPDFEPDEDVEKCVNKYHLNNLLHWKIIRNRSFTRSREMDKGVIGMIPDDIEENWFHELGHEIYDRCDKDKIKPVLDEIRNEYGLSENGLKWISIGGYDYSYSHSGKDYEYDELFAISFAFYEGDHEKFDDAAIDKEFATILKSLQDEPLFNKNPYTDRDSDGPIG